MNIKNYALVYILRIIEVVLQVIVFNILLMIAYSVFAIHDTTFLTYLLVATLPVVVLYIARRTCHQGILIALIHVGMILFMILMGKTVEEKIANTLVGIALMVISVNLRIEKNKENSEKLSVAMVGIFIVAVIIGDFLKFDNLAKAGHYCGEVFIILQVIYRNIRNLHVFFQANYEITTLPVKQMLSVNGFIMTVLLTLCGGVMLLFGNSSVNHMLRSLLTLISDALLYLIRFFFSLIRFSDNKEEVIDKMKPEDLSQLTGEAAKSSLLVDIINGIFMVLGIVLAVAVILAIIVGLVLAVVRLVKRMNSPQSGEDIKEFILSKEIRNYRLKQRNKKDITEKSTNAKIRKLYKSIVTKNAKKRGGRVSASMVPRDISKLYISGDQNIATEIYEKARYSNQQITPEEIEILKEFRKDKSESHPS